MDIDRDPALATWYCVRRQGAEHRSGWTRTGPISDLPGQIGAGDGDVVEVCTTSDYRPVAPQRFSRVFCNRERGLVGMELAFRGEVLRLAPTRMISGNLSFRRAAERFLRDHDAGMDDLAKDGRFRVFSARQLLLRCGSSDATTTELYRGGPIVSATERRVQDRAAKLAAGIGDWMIRNQSADGSIPYKYWPSRGVDSPADNAIRRFLACLALARLGELRGSPEIREAARRNLRFNLTRYFRDIGAGRGAIVERTGAKLGAAALAGLAILESPASGEFSPELELLAAGVESLAGGESGFRTFFFPPERDGANWNFYSGEALLFWAEAMRRKAPFAPTLERFTEIFARCRERHYRARNPAFIPWHTQACASLFRQTGRGEFAEFAFEINDWLLPMQQWDERADLPLDLRGRFYDPSRPSFGPPHAASTGAYLEGLTDAVALARMMGDAGRAAAYERAVARGLRSLRQLQFRNAHDAFYVSKRNRVMGALRTEAYDNAVRIDSAAHALAAAVNVLRL